MAFKNLTGKEIMLYWVDFDGQHKYPRKMKHGATYHVSSRNWCRYEAYYMDGKKFAAYVVGVPPGGTPYMTWEIKDDSQKQK